MTTNAKETSAFIAGYVEAMLFANTFGNGPECESADARGMTVSRDAMREATRDCRDFLGSFNPEEGDEALPETSDRRQYLAEWESYLRDEGAEQAGTDFALSRNGHGAGFFDRGTGYRALQKHARAWGERSWRVGRSGNVTTF